MAALYEVARTVQNRVCKLVQKDELQNYRGFRSYFGFPPAVADYFRSIGAVRGAKNFPVFADELLIDFDDAPVEAEKAYNIFCNMGLAFDAYDSGGRSIHLHLHTLPLEGYNVAYSHKKFLQDLGIVCDWSIYENNRLFRLPGTIHQRTRRPKVLLESCSGSPAEIRIIEPPKASYDNLTAADGIADFVETMRYTLDNPPQRHVNTHVTFFKVAAACRSGGFSADFTRELLEKLNEDLVDEPASEADFNKSVTNIFNSLFS